MKLKEYIENLQKLVNKNPKCLELQVIYAKDDEGNSFHKVHHTPTKGYYDSDDQDFQDEDIDEINAICIN